MRREESSELLGVDWLKRRLWAQRVVTRNSGKSQALGRLRISMVPGNLDIVANGE